MVHTARGIRITIGCSNGFVDYIQGLLWVCLEIENTPNGNSNEENDEPWDMVGSLFSRQVRRGIEYLDPKTYAEASYYEKCLRLPCLFDKVPGSFRMTCCLPSCYVCNVL